jgi:hypothetical protein
LNAGASACDAAAGALAGGVAGAFAGGVAGAFAGACCALTPQANSPSAKTAIPIRFIRPPRVTDERWLSAHLQP